MFPSLTGHDAQLRVVLVGSAFRPDRLDQPGLEAIRRPGKPLANRIQSFQGPVRAA